MNLTKIAVLVGSLPPHVKTLVFPVNSIDALPFDIDDYDKASDIDALEQCQQRRRVARYITTMIALKETEVSELCIQDPNFFSNLGDDLPRFLENLLTTSVRSLRLLEAAYPKEGEKLAALEAATQSSPLTIHLAAERWRG
eukprot:CAMPEP_0197323676 /NCGR_PEP_ID=MMETSP0891-20130614/70665_1 /TAXON_ID=44058 ORGANISM="Aureoumbra lagunensis, Strain CCMP1510" /NCGR_SAMPLE_ID=MMETSP0891 /ASSEMBLY_ACC=CAM_ASM_000534 /LENGTH=140 /DNA_ID=CAMNT_0042816371 /DNA_START=445 /DNA_END=867 /DNA_ORIENTATION=+